MFSEGSTLTHRKETIRSLQRGEHLDTPESFKKNILQGNELARRRLAEFIRDKSLPALLKLDSLPIVCKCSDGRTGTAARFLRDGYTKFAIEAVTQAGVIASPELKAINDAETDPLRQTQELLSDAERRKQLFTEFDRMYKSRIERQLARSHAVVAAAAHAVFEEDLPTTLSEREREVAEVFAQSGTNIKKTEATKKRVEQLKEYGMPVTLELQSHSHTDPHDSHGCGAHGCDTGKALQMTAIEAICLQEYINEQFTEDAHRIHVLRTHHLTGDPELVVDANRPDLLQLLSEKSESLAKHIGEQKLFTPTKYKDKEKYILGDSSKNLDRIDQEKHNEAVIRLSQFHEAFDQPYTDILEQSMLGDVKLTETIISILIGIAEKNRIAAARNSGKEQALFLHIDFPLGDHDMYGRYMILFEQLNTHPQIQERVQRGQLHLIATRTQPLDFRAPNALQTELFDPFEA